MARLNDLMRRPKETRVRMKDKGQPYFEEPEYATYDTVEAEKRRRERRRIAKAAHKPKRMMGP